MVLVKRVISKKIFLMLLVNKKLLNHEKNISVLRIQLSLLIKIGFFTEYITTILCVSQYMFATAGNIFFNKYLQIYEVFKALLSMQTKCTRKRNLRSTIRRHNSEICVESTEQISWLS